MWSISKMFLYNVNMLLKELPEFFKFFFKSKYFIYPSFQLLFESYLSVHVHKHQINHLVAIMRVLITAISLSTTLAFRVSVPAM